MTGIKFRLLLITLLILIGAGDVQAQGGYTTVTATVQDPNGQLYVNAPYTVTFVDPGTSGKLALLNNSPFQQFYSGINTDSFGLLSLSLPENDIICSTSGECNTQWRFNICSIKIGNTTYCFNYTRAINSTDANPFDITAQLKAAAATLPLSGGGGIPCTTLDNSIQYNNAAHFGCTTTTYNNSTQGWVFPGPVTLNMVNGHFWAGPGATPTIAAQEAAAIAAGGGIVDIAPGYTGAESANCSSTAFGVNVWNGNNSVTIVDWRPLGTATCNYSIQVNGATLGLSALSVFRAYTSPSTTASGGIFTATYTGNLVAGAGNLNGLTAESDTVGAITANPTATMTGLLAEPHIRSTGGNIPDLAAVSANVQSNVGSTTTVTRGRAFFSNPCVAAGGAFTECYGGDFARETAATTRNYSVYSRGRTRFGYNLNDNGIDLESTSGTPINILQNDATDAVSYRPLTDTKGSVFKKTDNTTLMAIGANNNDVKVYFGLSVGSTLTTNITGGGTQCAQVDNSGVLSGTGTVCNNALPNYYAATLTVDQSISATTPSTVTEAAKTVNIPAGGTWRIRVCYTMNWTTGSTPNVDMWVTDGAGTGLGHAWASSTLTAATSGSNQQSNVKCGSSPSTYTNGTTPTVSLTLNVESLNNITIKKAPLYSPVFSTLTADVYPSN